MENAECGARSAECGVRSAECGARSAECGVRSAERGVRSAECGVFCLRLQTILISDSAFSTEPGGSVENAESV